MPPSWPTDPEPVIDHDQHDADMDELSIWDYVMTRELKWVEQEYGGFTASERAPAWALMDEHPPATVLAMMREQRAA
jgi:hypothetical protein